MRAVVTAGGRIEGDFAPSAGTRVKALASVRGVTMLQRMLDALRAAGVNEIAVVGGDEVRAACGRPSIASSKKAPRAARTLARVARMARYGATALRDERSAVRNRRRDR